MLFIARRSDAKDGTVPPEPVGPMEVAPHERSTPWKSHTHQTVDLTYQSARNLLRS